MLEALDLDHYVTFATHPRGHSLALVNFFSKGRDVLSVSTFDMISDHFFVVADLRIATKHSCTVPQTITCTTCITINIAAFQVDINNFELIKYPKTNATELAQQYDSVLCTLIDIDICSSSGAKIQLH